MTKPRTCDKPTVALSAEKLGFEFSQKKHNMSKTQKVFLLASYSATYKAFEKFKTTMRTKE